MKFFNKEFNEIVLCQPIYHPFGLGLPMLCSVVMLVSSVCQGSSLVVYSVVALLALILLSVIIGFCCATVEIVAGKYDKVQKAEKLKVAYGRFTSAYFAFEEPYGFFQAQAEQSMDPKAKQLLLELNKSKKAADDMMRRYTKWQSGSKSNGSVSMMTDDLKAVTWQLDGGRVATERFSFLPL